MKDNSGKTVGQVKLSEIFGAVDLKFKIKKIFLTICKTIY